MWLTIPPSTPLAFGILSSVRNLISCVFHNLGNTLNKEYKRQRGESEFRIDRSWDPVLREQFALLVLHGARTEKDRKYYHLEKANSYDL
jgi:hypothetical protein